MSGSRPRKAAADKTASIYESPIPPVPANEIDKFVAAKLSSLKIRPVLCSDAVFVRRVYLDMTGTLPTADEARAFIDDPDTKNKRRALVDRLFGRSELGRRCRDTFVSLKKTCRKLGVSFWRYLQDRIRGVHEVVSLPELMRQAAQQT